MHALRRPGTAHTETGRLTAVLGPTNTGKTHLAVERMLGHRTGMIGCPLRLLAREIYDRVAAARGAGQVALITGEERIVPPRPRYFVCTAESMPLDRRVEFVAIDEVQLAADPERGHVFTDRLLRARGLAETMFLGAETIAPLIARLVPGAEFVSRPRFSELAYAGQKKLTRLPPRSAVVAFSAAEVYRIAELLRRFRGGAAVVMGALSPRTRNAQVALYQAGEVDYLVATDAIGMGLNLSVDHVAFAGVSKFDGREARELSAPEIAQIAGRAGRHMRDGSFGTTLGVGALDAGVVEAVESHSFEPLNRIYWRNARLDLSSVAALLHSLEAAPPAPALVRQREAEDLLSLRALAQMPDIAALAHGFDAVSLLWEVCRIPDFRKTMADQHVRMLAAIYRHLMGPAGRLPEAWVGRMVDRLDRNDGDIDTLATRIAHIRTWNYVAYRGDWVGDPAALQERTRGIEDALSDALHERLTRRFVDRTTALLARRLERNETPVAAVRKSGEVLVEGEYVGTLAGFDFLPDDAAAWRDARALRTAVRRALEPELRKRAGALVAAANDAFAVDAEGTVLWHEAPVARLARGPDALAPALRLLGGQVPEALQRRIEKRLAAWLRGHLAEALAPLMCVREAALAGAARGLAFQLAEGLGSVPRAAVAAQLAALAPADRKALARLGVRLGRETVFVAAMLKPRPVAVRALLWCVHAGEAPRPAPAARVSVAVDDGVPAGFYAATGYRPLGARALRVDMLERLTAALRRRARGGVFAPDAALFNLAGCAGEAFDGVVRALGYRPRRGGDDGELLYAAPLRQRQAPSRATRARRSATASPFAALAPLKRART